jgi:hypothetical protein
VDLAVSVPRMRLSARCAGADTARSTGVGAFKVHLDGYKQLPYLTGAEDKSLRVEFFYFSDDGDLTAFRYDPPRQKAASFSVDQVMEKVSSNISR